MLMNMAEHLKTGLPGQTKWTFVEYLAQLEFLKTSRFILVPTLKTMSASLQNAVVNKNSLQNQGLVGLGSLIPTLKGLLQTLQEQKFDADISLLVLKGTVSNHTVEHRLVACKQRNS